MTEQYPPISVVMIPEGHIFHAPVYPWGSANGSQGWIHPVGSDCGVCHLLKRSSVESPEDVLSRMNAKAMETGPFSYVVGGKPPLEGFDRGEDPIISRQRMKIEDLEVQLKGAEDRARLCLKAKDSAMASEQQAWETAAHNEAQKGEWKDACRKAERERDAARDIVLKALSMKG